VRLGGSSKIQTQIKPTPKFISLWCHLSQSPSNPRHR